MPNLVINCVAEIAESNPYDFKNDMVSLNATETSLTAL